MPDVVFKDKILNYLSKKNTNSGISGFKYIILNLLICLLEISNFSKLFELISVKKLFTFAKLFGSSSLN